MAAQQYKPEIIVPLLAQCNTSHAALPTITVYGVLWHVLRQH